MHQKATVYDVATHAGVSIATVSFAFTRPDKLKASTLDKVMQSAEELGYVPSANARGLARGRTGAIGLYAYDYLLEPQELGSTAPPRLGTLFPLYSDEVQRGVQLECRQRGFALMVGGNQSPAHLPQVIEVAGRVDGLIAFAGEVSEVDIRKVASRIPVVELGGTVHAPGSFTVYVDNRDSMAELTTHLISVHGFRRFAYLGEVGMTEFQARREGFSRALADAGIAIPEVTLSHAGDDPSTVRAVHHVMSNDPPEVIVCDTDQGAIVAVETLRELGFSVPGDIAVTGFDGILAGRLLDPVLTTVRQPMEEIGRAAVRILARSLAGEAPEEGDSPLASTFWLGRSCGCN